jgi:RNA polymerase sigma factor (sigma-70 family)
VRPDADIAAYEGLIFTTAARYAPLLDDDLEDIQQVLRVKVWQALRVYDPKRSKAGVKSYVFSCVRNQVKDLLKSQHRRNEARNGRLIHIEECRSVAGSPGDGERTPKTPSGAFESRYLSVEAEEVFALVEDEPVLLPSTLTDCEARVVQLLVAGFSEREIAKELHVPRDKVTAMHGDVQRKMMDWHPGGRVHQEVPTRVAA